MKQTFIALFILILVNTDVRSQQLTKLFPIADWSEIEYQKDNFLFAVHYGYWAYKYNMVSQTKVDSFKIQITPNSSVNEEARGLCWDGTYLWISEWGTDSLYKIDISNGKVVSKIKAPGSGPQGLAYGDGALWHTDEYQKIIFKINPTTGAIIKQLPISETSGWFIGIAYDNGRLWLSNHTASKIYQIDTANGSILKTFTLPSGLQPSELTMNGSDLLIGVIESSGHFVYSYSNSENVFTVYPNKHAIITGDSAKNMLPVKLGKGYYTVTAKFTSKPHAGGDIDGVFFWATTGENSVKWPVGHAIYESFKDNESIQLYSPSGFDGYLFFMDGGNLGDNSGSVVVTFKLDSIPTNVAEQITEKISLKFHLSQNFPNPFNPTTRINYEIKEQNNVVINIYDIAGRNIKTLLTEFHPSGFYTVTWDGKNENGESVGTGTYFYQLKVGDYSETKKMILIK